MHHIPSQTPASTHLNQQCADSNLFHFSPYTMSDYSIILIKLSVLKEDLAYVATYSESHSEFGDAASRLLQRIKSLLWISSWSFESLCVFLRISGSDCRLLCPDKAQQGNLIHCSASLLFLCYTELGVVNISVFCATTRKHNANNFSKVWSR